MDNPTTRQSLIDAECKLNDIIDKEMQGLITRARAKWTEEGERSTKYFYGLEKSNSKKKLINKLVVVDPEKKHNNILTNQVDISEQVVKHFKNIYAKSRPKKSDIDQYLTDLGSTLLTLDPVNSSSLESDISLLELDMIVKDLKNNISPGWDGLGSEFYKNFLGGY